MKRIFLLILITMLPAIQSASAQSDSLILSNRDVIIGEIKSMDRGVLIIKTDYSDSDFKIEWKGVREIYTSTSFFITLTDGRRFIGPVSSISGNIVQITDTDAGPFESPKQEIVYMKSLEDGFWSRLHASIDLGYSLTKANDLRQVNLRSDVGYMADRWSADASLNIVHSTQTEVATTRRTDGSLAFRQYLARDWYAPADLSFLSNTEQKLNLRVNARLGIGKYAIHTNRTYWGFAAGGSYVDENYSSEDPDRQSWEGYLGTELNMFDIGDLSLLTKAVAYPGITEAGRWRFDFAFDTKYDLPLDFYIKLGLTLNYDNRPVEGASDSDYVFQTGLGWEW